MGWDIMLIKTKTNREPFSSIEEVIPFNRSRVIETVRKVYPDTDCSDETWLVLNIPTLGVEFAIGKDEPIYSISLYTHGAEKSMVLAMLSYLCKELDCRVLDISSGEFFEEEDFFPN